MAVKNPTAWRPDSGFGSVVATGSLRIVTAAGLFLITKAGLFIVQNASQVIPKSPTSWVRTGKNATIWANADHKNPTAWTGSGL